MIAASNTSGPTATMAEWLRTAFGDSLCELFFDPFHQLYTAGLWRDIAPQDAYKSPAMLSAAVTGAFGDAPAAGYNVTFVYPEHGLDGLARRLASHCAIQYGKRVVRLDVQKREVVFADGDGVRYEHLISTLPLAHVMEMAGLTCGVDPDPYTSVLVVNIGAIKGPRCPEDHWVYVPKSRAGFHRVGFYSNVDTSFLPNLGDSEGRRVSIYVERAYRSGTKPTKQDLSNVCETIVTELREWGWIGDVEVLDPTWIQVAYTWSRPASRWKAESMKLLEKHGVYQVGRYARWVFQGIADSIRDGFIAGGAFKAR
jgi:protoporphyrinogen oxidase